jgi:hypothetical protein
MSTKASSILEIISATAVVVSLIFVGFEIRNSSEQVEQNTQALQIAAYQDLIGRIVEINAIDIEESTSIELLVVKRTPTEEDLNKLGNFLWILFRHGDMAYFQYEKGAISKERLESAMAPVLGRLQYQRVIAHWQETKVSFVPAYQEYIDQQISNYRIKSGT